MIAKSDLGYNVLVESDKYEIDEYFNLLRTKGWYDYVDAMVTPEENEEGVRIDNQLNFPRTIFASSIRCENMYELLGQVKFMRSL
jgi:hypothetical protein